MTSGKTENSQMSSAFVCTFLNAITMDQLRIPDSPDDGVPPVDHIPFSKVSLVKTNDQIPLKTVAARSMMTDPVR